MNKRYILGILFWSYFFLFVSCATSTIRPVFSDLTYPGTGNFKVLGRVTIEKLVGDAGYTILLEHARAQYPDCDDVVNIIIDVEKINTSGFDTIHKDTITMSGIAIKYIE